MSPTKKYLLAAIDAAEQGATEAARSALGDLQRTVLLMGKVLDAIGGGK